MLKGGELHFYLLDLLSHEKRYFKYMQFVINYNIIIRGGEKNEKTYAN